VVTIASAGGGLTGNGTLNYLPKYTGTGSTLGNSLIFDNGTNLGIGTTTPQSRLHIAVAPTASANYGTLSLGGAAFDGVATGTNAKFVGSTLGTSLAINEASTYTGNLIDAQLAGVSKFKVDYSGNITANGNTLTLNSFPITVNNTNNSFFAGASAGSGSAAINTVFIGYQAGNGATSAPYSTFLGYQAGNGATSATYSNFFGLYAGAGAANAGYSNFFGMQAGRYTNASYSNFFGYNTGTSANNATYSNFIGYQAGYGEGNASYSNLLGYQAGYGFTGDFIGSNNVIIGTNISLPNATANAINIGGVLFGTGTYSTTTGNPSITAVSGGRIGIGIVSPAFTLDVNGKGNFSDTLFVANIKRAVGSSSQILAADGSVITAGTNISINGGTINAAGNAGTVTSFGFTNANGFTGTVSTATTTPTLSLSLQNASATQSGQLSSTDWSTFNSKQNALTNPVTGVGANTSIAIWNGTNSITSDNTLIWDAVNNKMGISNSTPTELLTLGTAGTTAGTMSLAGATSGRIILKSAAAVTTWTMTLPSTDGTLGQFLQTDGNGVTSWVSASNSAWSLTGNVATNASNFIGTTDNVPLTFKVNNIKSGMIDQLLHNTFLGYHAGEITTATNNIAIGESAIKVNTTGNDNVAIGVSSLLNNIDGDKNIAIGTLALRANTNGALNTAIGYEALYNNTDSFNTAVGFQTLLNNTTGDRNTAVGHQAMVVNTTGFDNAAFGNQAMYHNLDGEGNAALGNAAVFNNSSGTYNAGFGYAALKMNATGNQNSAFGAFALSSMSDQYWTIPNTSSTGNTAMGFTAMSYNNGGNYNTAMGVSALSGRPLSGNGNVAIGYNAGSYVTTGSNNVIVGYNGGTVGITSGSNNIAIGYNAENIAIGSNNVFIGANISGYDNLNNYIVLADGSGNTRMVVDNYGNGTFNGSWTPYSDSTLKRADGFLNSNSALSKILQLQPRYYYWKNDKTQRHLGFFAQEVNTILGNETAYKNAIGKDAKYVMDDRALIAYLTKGMQEQQVQIDELKKANLEKQKQIENQEKINMNLEERLRSIEKKLEMLK
jgi:hypothetical protein